MESKSTYYRLATIGSGKEKSGKNKKKLSLNKKSHQKTLLEFLKNLKQVIGHNGASLESVFSQSESFSIEEFTEKIEELHCKAEQNEIESVFAVLGTNGRVSSANILKQLKGLTEDSSSSYSSDISSPSEAEYICDSIDIGKVYSVFEILAFKMADLEITIDKFSEIAREVMMELATAATVNRFFLKKEFRIEDGPVRNMVVSYLMEGKKGIETGKVIKVLEEQFFSTRIEEISKFLLDERKNEFIALCKNADTRKTGFLSWGQLQGVLRECDIDPCKEVKYYCYRIEKSLDMIPYQLV